MPKNHRPKHCIVCGETKYQPYGGGLVKCQTCGLVVAEHIPGKKELDKLYEEEYFFGMEYSDYKIDRPALEKNFVRRIKKLEKYLSPSDHIVEVGSAYGYFLNLIKDKVKSHQGFDVSKEGIEYSKKELGLNASTEDFLKATFKKKAKGVFMWDVIEHVPEPDLIIKKAAEIMPKGGVLSLTTGDIGALMARVRGPKWRMIHPPTHIYYFDKPTMIKLLEKKGFRVVSFTHEPLYRNVDSVLNQLTINRKAKKKFAGHLKAAHQVAKATKLTKVNVPLNLYDVMEVIAVKK